MNAVLWVLQVLLAVVFLAAGGLKLARPKEALLPRMGALAPYRPVTVKLIGAAEVAGALGLVLAPLVGWSAVVPWAALGLGTVLVFGAIAHAEQREWSRVPVPLAVLAVAVVVMVGRSADVPL